MRDLLSYVQLYRCCERINKGDEKMGGRANFAAEVLGEKQRVFQWIRRWMRENEAEEKNVASFDLPDLIILLQCAGFVLHKFQSDDEFSYTNPTSITGDTLKIELNCSKSGMRAEMLKAVQTCTCPIKEDIKTEEFFSVTSCAPSIKGSSDVSLSSFLPSITHPKQKVVGDIFKELITIIRSENEKVEDPDSHHQDVRATIERMSVDPTKSLMQNLKDIKRVVDSFLGDKEQEEGASFLRRNMEERAKTPEKHEEIKASPAKTNREPVLVKPKAKPAKVRQAVVDATIKKAATPKMKKQPPTLGLVATASVFGNTNNSNPVRHAVQENKKAATTAKVNNKSKVGRIAPTTQGSFNPLSANKFGRTTRSKKI